MKLTEEQIAAVKQLVKNEVQFNETYIEVYDHMVTALESRTEIRDIQKAYAEILEQDFGGHGGLEKFESGVQYAISLQIRQDKWQAFSLFFKWPLLPLTLLFAALTYYFANFKEVRLTTGVIMLVAVFLPLLFLPVSNFIVGLKGKLVKPSVKDNALNTMMRAMFTLYMRLLFLGFFVNAFTAKYRFGDIPLWLFPVTVMLCAVFCTLHTIAIFKVYGKEYKSLIKQ